MIYDKQQAQLRKIFGDTETSPAGLSYKMLGESKYINESVLQYIINYIIIFGTRDLEHLPHISTIPPLSAMNYISTLSRLG